MSPRLPALTARQVIERLRKVGFVFDRQAKGSHEIWYDPASKRRTVIPNHPGVAIPRATLRAILKQAGISPEDFLQL
jgi:predicted RNA binding protein YcfA (HicA-like mRNA interferase family)